jgi:dUTP pyrophosphatase
MNMEVRFKKLCDDAVTPTYAKKGDAGMDLTAISKEYDNSGNVVYGTGIAVEIPEGYVGLIFPRSSLSNYKLLMSNSVGVIDSGYRGEIKFKFKKIGLQGEQNGKEYVYGDRVGQLVIIPYPHIELQAVMVVREIDGL